MHVAKLRLVVWSRKILDGFQTKWKAACRVGQWGGVLLLAFQQTKHTTWKGVHSHTRTLATKALVLSSSYELSDLCVGESQAVGVLGCQVS